MITMSHKEIDRLLLSKKHISQTKVAKHLDLSTRQVRRLIEQLHAEAVKGLASKHWDALQTTKPQPPLKPRHWV
ncbi:MAG: hypothetical protein A6F72_02435 [Cycloclasticus sp. symbiont of Poecilosclerida sp. N]|nr:MAG: hypothetical protein A6F72_02435 [Cycloclasticus sp. symbiont of Poecilosclerida sp. N]